MSTTTTPTLSPELEAFRLLISERGSTLYRDLPWRRTHDPYEIWISEVMLQQTQVSRVDGRWQRWLERFPSVDALAASSQTDVLAEWQGLGYNRRALAVLRAAQIVSQEHGGTFPREVAELKALPGIGPTTAAGIRAFAFDLPGVYLDTNVRAVFLHELFPDAAGVPDRELIPLVEATCPQGEGSFASARLKHAVQADERTGSPQIAPGNPSATPSSFGIDGIGPTPADILSSPRAWYYALLDYGFELKRTGHNAARRSAAHVKQSRFEGSFRQKRAEVVRILLASPTGLPFEQILSALSEFEQSAHRDPVDPASVEKLLAALEREGFCRTEGELWRIA